MYIEQAYKGMHEWWRYFIGLIFILFGWQFLGAIPFGIAIFVKMLNEGADLTNLNQDELLTLLEPNLNLFLMLFMFAVGLGVLFLVVKVLHNQSFVSLTTSRKKIDWKRFWFVFVLWGVISSSFVFIEYYTTPENYELNFKLVPFLILCVVAIIMVPLQTSLGVITKNKWAPLFITSVIFGLLHIANPEVDKLGPVIMVYYIGTGLFLGILTLMDEGMELALGFHAANNLFTALLVTADWTAFKTHSVFKDLSEPSEMGLTEIIIPVFVIFPVLLFIFSKIYKWENWHQKLFGSVNPATNIDVKVIDDIGTQQ